MRNIKHGITIIEIMVVISIMGIIALFASRMDFRSLTEKQKYESISLKIENSVEEALQNALLGKNVGTGIRAQEWKVSILPSKVQIFYNTGASDVLYNEILPLANTSFVNFKCFNITKTLSGSTSSGTIIIGSGATTLSGCSSPSNAKILNFQYGSGIYLQNFWFNSVTGIFEKK